MAASEILCRDFIDSSYKSASFRILEDSIRLQLIYFFNYDCILDCEILFSDQWDILD